jgi:transcriptional regulator with XRE-family HTH domain
MTEHRYPILASNPMIDFRVRRPASVKPKKAEIAKRVAHVVGTSLRDIRRRQGHSLDSLAAASGVSRAMLGQIETGKSVPTITVLWKVADALGVPVADLISDPDVVHYTVTRRSDTANPSTEHNPFQTRPLLPSGAVTGYAIEELDLAKGHHETFVPRRDGSRSSLVAAHGSVTVTFDGDTVLTLEEGDAIHFSTGLKHTVSNSGRDRAILYLVVATGRNSR